jgi:hypothetical protein
MNLNRFLNPVLIEKTVDPGQGDTPKAIFTQKKSLPVEQEREIKETTIETQIKDIIEEAKTTQEAVLSIINEITEENINNDLFNEYHKLVAENHFNPAVLIKNPSARPNPIHEPNKIKAAERQVYRNSPDPRAPFIQDLYEHATEAGMIEYSHQTYWARMVNNNDLYSSFNADNAAFMLALGKDRQTLLQTRESANRIQRNRVERLNYQFLNAMSSRLVNQLQILIPREAIIKINEVIQILLQLRVLLLTISIANGEYWEQFSSNIRDIYGDTLQLIATRISRLSAYPIIGGVQNKVIEFVDDLVEFLPLDVTVSDIPEAREFVNQINGSIGHFIRQIEDDLVYREGIQIKVEENRQHLILNSQKNSKTNQFIKAVESAIKYLEQLKITLSGLEQDIATDLSMLTDRMVDGVDKYVRSGTKTGKRITTPGINSAGNI